jgi:hypothetical protein
MVGWRRTAKVAGFLRRDLWTDKLVHRYGILCSLSFLQSSGLCGISTELKGLASRAFMNGDPGTEFENQSLDRVNLSGGRSVRQFKLQLIGFWPLSRSPLPLPTGRPIKTLNFQRGAGIIETQAPARRDRDQ